MRLRESGVAALAGTALCFCATAPAAPQAATDTESAVWAAKELNFVYQGFTAKYSCDGLQDKMRRVLLTLGARADMQLQQTCTRFTGPDPFAGVRMKINVLQPAGTASSAAAVSAHWQSVDLVLDRDPIAASADCELVEQVKQHVLPLFTTRNVEYGSSCVPHQLQVGGTYLRADVLITDKSPASANAVEH